VAGVSEFQNTWNNKGEIGVTIGTGRQKRALSNIEEIQIGSAEFLPNHVIEDK
jgi:hypothetical protein